MTEEKKYEDTSSELDFTPIRVSKRLIKNLRKKTKVSILGVKRTYRTSLSDQQIVELALADFLDAKAKIIELNNKAVDKKIIITLTQAKSLAVDANNMKKELSKTKKQLEGMIEEVQEQLEKQLKKSSNN